MDRHNLTSYPLKLPFIRSSKIARRRCLYENERSVTEFGDYRCRIQGPTSPQYPNTERITLQSKISVAPAKKAPIEIQLDNFREKAIQMGFASEDDRPLSTIQTRSAALQPTEFGDYSSNKNFMYPQSQPLPTSYVTANDPPILWSQQVSKQDVYHGEMGTSVGVQPFTFDSHNVSRLCQSQHDQAMRTSWPARNEFHFSQPVESYMGSKSRHPSEFNIRANLALHNGSFYNDKIRHMPYFQESQPRSIPYESTQIPYETAPQDNNSTAGARRWYGDSFVNRSLETSSQQPFSWNKQGSWSRSDDDSGSLRGILSQLDRRKNERSQPITTKSHRCQAVYGTDLEPDNEDWDKSFLSQNRTHQPSQKIILDLSPIDKSSPRNREGQKCQCCRRSAMTNRSSQTCSPAPQAKRPRRVNARVQTDNIQVDRSRNLVDRKCQTSFEEKDKSLRLDDTDPNLFNSNGHSNTSNNERMGHCTSFVASEPDEELLGHFLIGVEREP